MKFSKLLYIFLFLFCLFSTMQLKGENTIMCGLTNDGDIIAISDIECLVADAYSSTFSVCFKSGKIVSNINSLSLGYREESSVNSLNKIDIDKEILICNNKIEISMLSKSENLCIVDLKGRLLWSGISNGSKMIIDLTTFPSGYYFLKTGNQTFKILKK